MEQIEEGTSPGDTGVIWLGSCERGFHWWGFLGVKLSGSDLTGPAPTFHFL